MWLGLKDYEVRKLDRGYEPGDTLHLREWHHHIGYTGRAITVIVKHILAGGFGLQDGYGVLGVYGHTKFKDGILVREDV